jgi:hypothetical protein
LKQQTLFGSFAHELIKSGIIHSNQQWMPKMSSAESEIPATPSSAAGI